MIDGERCVRGALAGAALAAGIAASAAGQCDPQETQTLQAASAMNWGDDGPYLGQDLAVDGDAAAIAQTATSPYEAGPVHLFRRDAQGVWSLEDSLQGNYDDAFGHAVALAPDVVLVGAPQPDLGPGYVRAYRRLADGTWALETILTPDPDETDTFFGARIAFDGETALVDSSGGVYVFRRDASGFWTQEARLDPADEPVGFGSALAVDGDTVLVAAVLDDDNGYQSGSAYVFTRDGGAWTQRAKLLPDDGAQSDWFGWGAALEGDTAVLSAAYDDDQGEQSGSVYVFRRDGEAWAQTAKLLAADGQTNDVFGSGLDLEGDTLLVGATGDDDLGTGVGAAYLFRRAADGVWIEQAKFHPGQWVNNAGFGLAVALDGPQAIVSQPFAPADEGIGLVHVFDLNCAESIPATLTDVTLAYGTPLGGGLPELEESDDAFYRARSRVGLSAFEPNLVEVLVGAATAADQPATLSLAIEARINNPGGTARVRLRNWATNGFQQVDAYPIGFAEELRTVTGIDATDRVRASDGRIETSIKHVVVATFSALGFDSSIDFVGVEVQE